MDRLFLALWPDAATRDAIARWQQGWAWPAGAARVRAERLHLTLHFLGNVESARVAALVAGLRVPFRPFILQFGQGELWLHGVAVLAPTQVPEALQALHGRLAGALKAQGLPTQEREFRPHVTMARRAAHAAPPARGPALTWQVRDGYVLARSLPGGQGYGILARF